MEASRRKPKYEFQNCSVDSSFITKNDTCYKELATLVSGCVLLESTLTLKALSFSLVSHPVRKL